MKWKTFTFLYDKYAQKFIRIRQLFYKIRQENILVFFSVHSVFVKSQMGLTKI